MTIKTLDVIRDTMARAMEEAKGCFEYYRGQKEGLTIAYGEKPTKEQLEALENLDKKCEKYGNRQYELYEAIKDLENIEVLKRIEI